MRVKPAKNSAICSRVRRPGVPAAVGDDQVVSRRERLTQGREDVCDATGIGNEMQDRQQ
jgi:hypothetical protein